MNSFFRFAKFSINIRRGREWGHQYIFLFVVLTPGVGGGGVTPLQQRLGHQCITQHYVLACSVGRQERCISISSHAFVHCVRFFHRFICLSPLFSFRMCAQNGSVDHEGVYPYIMGWEMNFQLKYSNNFTFIVLFSPLMTCYGIWQC